MGDLKLAGPKNLHPSIFTYGPEYIEVPENISRYCNEHVI